MEMLRENSPIRYIYCLVDRPNNRFKLGATLHRNYAPTLIKPDDTESFQAGYIEEYALVGERILRQHHAADILTGPGMEPTTDGVWMRMSAFEMVRATLCGVSHVVPPTVLLLIQAEAQKALLCAEIEKMLGMR